MGYPIGTKGYKVYDIQDKRIKICRYVLICEETFPFKNNKTDYKDEDPIKFQNNECQQHDEPTQFDEPMNEEVWHTHNSDDTLISNPIKVN